MWEQGNFLIRNYLSGGQVTTLPILAQLVHPFTEFTDESLVRDRIVEAGFGDELLGDLLEADVLVVEGSELARKEDLLEQWTWGHDARCFHFSTQQVSYTFDDEAIREHFERKAAVDPPPSPFKEFALPQFALPDELQSASGGLYDTLRQRRTTRSFQRVPLTLRDLASILQWTWGKMRFYNDSQLDRRIIKTSPSGGARHPVEVYPVVQRVQGVESGLYHYSVKDHALVLLREGLFEERMVELFSGQWWIRDAAVLFFMTAVLPRSMWKYDHSRAYRVVLLDAGHLGQTFHLACTALGLGPFTTAALQDRKIEQELGLDGVTETVLYAGATGYARHDT